MNEKSGSKNITTVTDRFKKIKARFSGLSKSQKLQFAAASFFTLVLVIGVPVYAWFTQGGNVEAFTKIKEPDELDIRAGHFDAVQYFDLRDIDIESMIETGTPHRVVFSVSAGDYKIPYQLQLAHTTNIPFKYRIFRAAEHTSKDKIADPEVTYISAPLKNRGADADEYTFYYEKYQEIALTQKNPDTASLGIFGRQLAIGSGSYYNETYDPTDVPEVYAVPIYEQSGKIPYDNNSEHDYFILEISWDDTAAQNGNFAVWNTAENKKETDMIYLTASRYTE